MKTRKNNDKLVGKIAEDDCQMRTSVDILADRAKWKRMLAAL